MLLENKCLGHFSFLFFNIITKMTKYGINNPSEMNVIALQNMKLLEENYIKWFDL